MKNRAWVSSALFAAMIVSNSLPVLFGESAGVVAGSVVTLWGGLCALAFSAKQKPNSKAIIIASILLVAQFLSYAFHPSEVGIKYLTNFLIYGALFLLIPLGNIDFNQVIKFVSYYGIILLPFYARYDYGYGFSEVEDLNGVLMTMSYRMLPFIIASLVVFLNRKNKLWERFLGAGVAILYLIVFFIIGARGAITSLIAFVALYYIISGKKHINKRARLFVVSIAAVVFFLSLDVIIDYLFDLLDSRGITSRSIERLYFGQMQGNDISSGRFKIYDMAFNEFFQSPIWGNGIGSFDSYKGTMPHNIILQLMVEGGLFFVIPFTIILVQGLMYIYEEGRNSDSVVFMLFIFCAGVIRLFFSSFLWGSHFCWLFILMVLNINSIKKNERISINNNSNV